MAKYFFKNSRKTMLARWYFCIPKIQILAYFGEPSKYIMAI
jgi:hypothetical protein